MNLVTQPYFTHTMGFWPRMPHYSRGREAQQVQTTVLSHPSQNCLYSYLQSPVLPVHLQGSHPPALPVSLAACDTQVLGSCRVRTCRLAGRCHACAVPSWWKAPSHASSMASPGHLAGQTNCYIGQAQPASHMLFKSGKTFPCSFSLPFRCRLQEATCSCTATTPRHSVALLHI